MEKGSCCRWAAALRHVGRAGGLHGRAMWLHWSEEGEAGRGPRPGSPAHQLAAERVLAFTLEPEGGSEEGVTGAAVRTDRGPGEGREARQEAAEETQVRWWEARWAEALAGERRPDIGQLRRPGGQPTGGCERKQRSEDAEP